MVQSFRSFLADFSANMMQNTEYSTDFRGKMLVAGRISSFDKPTKSHQNPWGNPGGEKK